MVGSGQIVVNRLRDADNHHFPAFDFAVFRKLVNGVHRIISADIEKIFDVITVEYFFKFLVFIRFKSIGKFMTAGAESGCWSR